jgi:hypothetical protein
MINLTKGLTQTIYFTATEKATISNPYFLFVFIHRVTGDVVKLMATNQSITGRYDSFAFTVNNYFNLKEEGFWGYTIHQKVSSSDLTVSGLVLEEGYMFLNPATPFEPTKYEEQNNNFVTYGL